jgi:Acyl-protein synthetase, LuxE
MTFDDLIQRPQYSIPQAEKQAVLLAELTRLGQHHRQRSPDYARLIRVLFPGSVEPRALAEVPYLPVSLFKERVLSSVPESEIFKILESSGTTGQTPSRIVLDRETAQLQTLALSRIMTSVLGPNRLPMILVETADLIRDRRQFNARAAGLLGMLNFGRNHFYALDSNLELLLPQLKDFLRRFGSEPFLIFGFTFLVWSRFYQPLADAGIDLSNGILVHSGGWKKLQEQAVSAADFRAALRRSMGLNRVYNFYGMVEQVGSVFLEGDDGYLYPPNFADVIVRDPYTFEEVPDGQSGVLEVLSALPRSYPGHCLLTEDLGIVHAVDSSTCGRLGKAFSVLGRIPQAELRGCSDVIAARVS